MAKLIAVVSTAFVFLLLILPRGSFFSSFRSPLAPPAMVREIRELNQLATVRYTIQKVVGMSEEKQPLGSEKILLLVQGKVVAGVNLQELTAEGIALPKRTSVRLRLPAPEIQEAFLEEKFTQVWDRGVTWWTPWISPSKDLEHRARMQALADIRAAALEMGILNEAKTNASTAIRKLLGAFGFQSVEITFGPPQKVSRLSGGFNRARIAAA